MKLKKLHFWVLGLAALTLSACPSFTQSITAVHGEVPQAFKTRNAVILVLDGPRQSEMWADKTRQYIPHLAKNLAPKGVLLSGFKNLGPTYTAAGHCALSTGFYEELENGKGTEYPRHPSIFQLWRREKSAPEQLAWIIVSKDKLHILGNTSDPTWVNTNQPKVWAGNGGKGFGAGYGQDADTVAQAKKILTQDHPRLVLINLKEPDAGGHSGQLKKYLDGLMESDAYAQEIWDYLQKDEFYAGKTALFITHDHGRHLDGIKNGFIDHGDGCPGCRSISLLALGPDFRRGAEIKHGGELIDIPVTIARMLGFIIPGAKGRVLHELF